MDYINTKSEKIGSLDVAISNDNVVTINRLNDVTTVTLRDRNTGKDTAETFLVIHHLESKQDEGYFSFTYSALASFRMGMSGSASFQSASLHNGCRDPLDCPF
jgi:hypothetical protein